MTTSQLDQLQSLACRVNLCSLAVRALGTDADHQAVEEVLVAVVGELQTLAEVVR
jgi:hypothetical protein